VRYLLSEAACAAGGVLRGPDRPVRGASIDSRTVSPGELFFALPGTRTDGHEYVPDVLDAGAYAVVSLPAGREGVIEVESVPDALFECARGLRGRLGGLVAAVTGSSGKTTTRELLRLALSPAYSVESSGGNLNNRLGLPLSILRADEHAGALVLELGMNHAGELSELGALAAPDCALVTNIGTAHIEHLGSRDGIAAAKAELLEQTRRGGVCVIPAGEPLLLAAARGRELEVVEAGEGGAVWLSPERGWRAMPWDVPIEVTEGRHNAMNALMAMAMAERLGVAPADSARAMSAWRGAPGRGREVRTGSLTILDESYNANPDSVAACLELLRDRPGRRAAVLGDMLELGEASGRFHREILGKAAGLGLEYLVLVGRAFPEAAGELGIAAVAVPGWSDALGEVLVRGLEDLTILVKGSHRWELDRLVGALGGEV
jgi:UDP-N-acetylmuramoyl-tripeptide--D-alanyl-D-alanine ligase